MEKSRFVGLRLTPEEEKWVDKLKEYLGFDTKTAVLTYALKQLAGEYSLVSRSQKKSSDASTWQKVLERISTLQLQAKEQMQILEDIKNRDKEVLKNMIENLKNIENIVDRHERKKNKIIQILLDIQKEHGWISKEVISWLSSRFDIPKTRIYHIVTFYKAFSLIPRGRHEISVCMGTACHVREAPVLLNRIQDKLNIIPGETTDDNKFTLETVNCLGCCALGPVVKIDDEYYSNPSNKELVKIFDKYD